MSGNDADRTTYYESHFYWLWPNLAIISAPGEAFTRPATGFIQKGNTMKKLALAMVGTALLTGCSDRQAPMKDMVRANLTDPDSAQFGRYEQLNSKKRDWACLEVNSKGQGGGYIGNQAARFVATAGTANWEFSGIAGSFDDCVRMLKDMQPFEGGPR